METKSVVTTEVILSDESVRQVVTAEMAKAAMNTPEFLERLIHGILFSRPEKLYSSDADKPTYFETFLRKSMEPIIIEEIKKAAESHRRKISTIISRCFKSKIIDNKEFETKLIERLAKFSSNISFYVSDKF